MWKRLKWHIGHRADKGRILEVIVSICIGIFLASICIHWINGALRPQMVALAEARISNQITRIANQAVRETLMQNRDIHLTESDVLNGSELTVLTLNPVLLNQLRLSVTDAINDEILALDKGQLDIPLGSATGLDLLSGIGPGVPVHILSVSSVSADFRSEFQSAGINQTLHQMMLDVNISTKLLLPGYRAEVPIYVPICIAENIIIGNIPHYWTPSQQYS